MPGLDDTIALLRDANIAVAEVTDYETPAIQMQRASALALVAIGVNLERIADMLGTLVDYVAGLDGRLESFGADLTRVRDALETMVFRS